MAAGDDLQLPPRRHATGLLDDVVDAGRVDLVPLEWHYRSGCPTLIGASNALFYGSRLVAPACAPRDPGLVVVEVDAPMASARGPPAGLVNEGQARRIADDVVALVKEADAAGAPVNQAPVAEVKAPSGLSFKMAARAAALRARARAQLREQAREEGDSEDGDPVAAALRFVGGLSLIHI